MKYRNRLKSELWQKGIYYLLVLFMAVGLKYFYSRAGSEDLDWILSPTATLVECLSGTHFEKEINIGYVSLTRNIAVVPACAGLNFMIAAFCMSAMCLLYSMRRRVLLSLCVITGLVSAYLLTVAVNGLRIVISMYLYEANIYSQIITPERVHRVEGVVIYIIILSLFYFAVRKITSASMLFTDKKNKENTGWMVRDALYSSFIPIFWYFLIALAVPVVNNAHYRNGSLFREHCITVLTAGLIIFLVMFLILICYKFFIRNKNYREGYSS